MSKRTRTYGVVIGLAVLSLAAGAARADLPANRFMEYYIRETPENPQSDVILIVSLELWAIDQDGDEVAWKVESVTLTKPASGGGDDTVWVDASPAPDTADGYWWIEHDDPSHPLNTEFASPPAFEDTAIAVDPEDPDLAYEFGGDYCDSQCQQLFNGQVGAADYFFILSGEEEPEGEGDDEPVEVDGEIVDP